MRKASRNNWYGRCVLASGDNLEPRILQALDDPRVGQAQFSQMMQDWLRATNPSLLGAKFDRRKPNTKGGDLSTTYLSGQNSPALMQAARRRKDEHGQSNMGLIIQPFTKHYLASNVLNNFDGFGIDNGMFTQAGQKAFNGDTYEKMVKLALAQEKRELGHFHFFTVPDEPFNWGETLNKFNAYRERVQKLRDRGAPVAIVLQNGAKPGNVPWHDIDTLFIGGDDAYKTGPDAKACTQHAQKLGMNIHMGRVNTGKRMDVASEWGVNSADGTYLMHEMAKTLWDIEQKNPQKPGERPDQYAARIKHLFENGDHPQAEGKLVDKLISDIVDGQLNNPANRRYRELSQYMKQTGRPMHRDEMMGIDQHLPQLQGFEPDMDVVRYDETGHAMMDTNGRPMRNPDVFNTLRRTFQPDQRVPIPGADFKEKGRNTNAAIKRWRDMGIMPR